MATVADVAFKTKRKDVLQMRLGDGDGAVTIRMLPPTKDIHDDMTKVGEIIDGAMDGTIDRNEIDDAALLEVVANAMSNNTDLTRITPENLENEGFEMSDVADFVTLYRIFLVKLVEAKN